MLFLQSTLFTELYRLNLDVAHGREEIRTCWVMDELDYLERHEWPALKSLIVVDATVLRKGKERYQRRFFLSSEAFTAEAALSRVRAHWSIENQQHYPLDVIWREDSSRTRAGFAAQNLAVLRRFALNLLNLDESKLTKRRKRLKALLDDSYLPKLLGLERTA
jgi:predicted transposase YbfD/YdcC